MFGRVRRFEAGSPDEENPAFFVVVPVRGHPSLANSTRQLVTGLRTQAQKLASHRVAVVAADTTARRIWCAETGEPLRFSELRRRLVVLMGPAFLLADPPPIKALMARAAEQTLAWCGSRSTRDAYAVALRGREVTPPVVWAALRLITACPDDVTDVEWDDLVRRPPIAPAPSWPEHSPALMGVDDVRGRRLSDSAPFVNAAFREMLTGPEDRGPVDGRPERMAVALAAQREVSRVPWIFNALLNEIEFKLGSAQPLSIPPEVHLSITGVCNIECRFCAYEHEIARRDFVDVDRVSRLDFLRFAQTFRLHSGLGEPTANRHLPAIIEHVASRFPHIGMNFFTNAVTLARPGLIEALVGNVRWINASLNAAGRASWKELCGADLFDRVGSGLRALHRAKRERRTLHPLVFGSMVLTRANVEDLPRMPALCRELGVDRFTAFPYSGLGYHGQDKFGPEMTLEACRDRYDALYEDTVREAEAHGISLEIPLPGDRKQTRFGSEARPMHDFARIESNEWKIGRFVHHLKYDAGAGTYCHFLWRSAAIGSTNDTGHAPGETHYMYPCIGPLSTVDLSRRTAFRFPETGGFRRLWRNPVFTLLRRAQHESGLSPVCDVCRHTDTRDPREFPRLQRLVADFASEHGGLPEAPVAAADQIVGIST